MWKVRWISFLIGGDGDNAGGFENEGFVGQKIQSGKTLTIWQKWILSGERHILRQNHGRAFLSYPKAYTYYGRFVLNVVTKLTRKQNFGGITVEKKRNSLRKYTSEGRRFYEDTDVGTGTE